ncbi:MAG: PIN/TRAM domain-containing protein [Planctomycetia bacterium]
MAILVLRALFVMVSIGIAVLIFGSDAMRHAPQWLPWGVLAAMIALPLVVMAIDAGIKRKDLTTITAVYFGLLVGVLLTYVSMLALSPILPPDRDGPVWMWLPVILGAVLCYICTSLLLQTRDDFRFLIPYVEFARDVRGLRPNVLDAAAIVDGRIADLAETGLFESRFVVPSFVLDELQATAESAERTPRTRGRRGLEVLSRMRANRRIDIDVIPPGDDDDASMAAESRVVSLARRLGGRVLTADASVVKVAGLRDVAAINVNAVALSLKPTFVPGDALAVRLVKQGEEPDQGVGYLDDGTMVVVQNGRDQIGRTVRVSVTSTLQTTAGRLVFARPEASRA